MTNQTKTIFDFPREQHKHLQLEGNSGWHDYKSWSCWSFDYASQREARLVKREPRTVSNEFIVSENVSIGAPWLLDTFGRDTRVRYTITEIIPGAEPEPDWKAECERLKKRVNELVDGHQTDRRLIAERDDRIRDLEGSLAAASAAVQKLETQVSNEQAHSRELQEVIDISAKRRGDLVERVEYLEETLKAAARAAEVKF